MIWIYMGYLILKPIKMKRNLILMYFAAFEKGKSKKEIFT
jgi:hypothetical protein